MTPRPFILVAILSFAAACGHSLADLIVEAHDFRTVTGKLVAAEKGRFMVPENRKRGTEKRIELAFVRFRSTSPTPGSPIVYLAGGPGGAGTDAPRLARFPLFMALREVADVIAFDQRGTGMSHRLPPAPRPIFFPADKPVTRAEAEQAFRDYALEMANYWREQGVDLDAYNTEESADDLEDLRKAIGAEKITLWGMSYGTHLALAAIKRHPASIDRLVLAGIEGPDQTLKPPHQQQELLAKIDALIKADPETKKTYPDFLGNVERVLRRVEERPAVWRVDDSSTYALSKFELQRLTAGMLWGPSDFRSLPSLFRALEGGDFTPLNMWVQSVKSDRLGPMSAAMDAASGVSPNRQAMIEQEREKALLGDAVNFPWQPVVEGLRVADLGEGFRANPRSPTPALFISGTLDGRTPPENAEEILKGFPNGLHLIIDGAGHGDPLFLSSPRILEVMLAFLRGEEVQNETIALPQVEFAK
jgi:pimeloyl-ACP methyl ester carboxylesterase